MAERRYRVPHPRQLCTVIPDKRGRFRPRADPGPPPVRTTAPTASSGVRLGGAVGMLACYLLEALLHGDAVGLLEPQLHEHPHLPLQSRQGPAEFASLLPLLA